MKKVFENVEIGTSLEDSGDVMINEMSPDNGECDSGLYLRLVSWDETQEHASMKEMGLDVNKKYRVTLIVEPI